MSRCGIGHRVPVVHGCLALSSRYCQRLFPSPGDRASCSGIGCAPPSVLDLVDDLSSGQLIYSSTLFNGEWTRYAQSTGITWDTVDMADAIVDDSGNKVLHVKATFTVSDWGVDIVLPPLTVRLLWQPRYVPPHRAFR